MKTLIPLPQGHNIVFVDPNHVSAIESIVENKITHTVLLISGIHVKIFSMSVSPTGACRPEPLPTSIVYSLLHGERDLWLKMVQAFQEFSKVVTESEDYVRSSASVFGHHLSRLKSEK